MSNIQLSYLDPETPVAVIGHGSWATALVKILTDNKNRVFWYVRNAEVIEHLHAHGNNNRYLSNVHFSFSKLTVSDDLDYVVKNSSILVLATPSAFIHSVMENLTLPITDKYVISSIKGIIPTNYVTIAEYVNQQFGLPFSQIGIISGPCHAEEVAMERLSYLTMVCKDIELAKILGTRFESQNIQIRHSTDIYGVEYAAMLKNIYAIAVGMCHSLRYGDNFIAVLIANAVNEMDRFMKNTYPYKRDVLHSVYLGDLLVTCYSQFSRNRTFGLMVGKGYSVKTAQMEMNMVAEGYYATACIQKVLEKLDKPVNMPIVQTMYRILYGRKQAKKEIEKLLDTLV